MLDWINTNELPALFVLIAVLFLVGQQMVRGEVSRAQVLLQWTGRLAATAFVFFAIVGIYEYRATTITAILAVVLKALLAAALTYGVAAISLAASTFLFLELLSGLKQAMKEHADRISPLRDETVMSQLAEKVPLPATEVKVKTPTLEERANELRRRYEAKQVLLEKLGLDAVELRAAMEHAKSQYLREIDGLMK